MHFSKKIGKNEKIYEICGKNAKKNKKQVKN